MPSTVTRRKRGPLPLALYGNIPANKRPASQTVLGFWIKSRGLERTAFARKVGCNVKMVEYWCTGRCLPTLVYAFAIERATDGGVPVASWLGTEIGKLQWRRLEGKGKA